MQHERGYIICIINMLTGLYVTPAVCMCFCQHCNGILFYMCSMSSGQLGKDVTSLYTVNKNKHNRRTFIKSSVSVQPLLTHTPVWIFLLQSSHPIFKHWFSWWFKGQKNVLEVYALMTVGRHFLYDVNHFKCIHTCLTLAEIQSRTPLQAGPGLFIKKLNSNHMTDNSTLQIFQT